MRPGTRIRFWNPKFSNRPDVSPPFLLSLVGVFALLSVVGVLVYGVASTLAFGGSPFSNVAVEIYIAVLHGLLPFGLFYTIFVNSPWSRPFLTTYVLILSTATAFGYGLLGTLPVASEARVSITLVAGLVTLYWLYRSSKMRVYYLLVTHRTVPDDLLTKATKVRASGRLSTLDSALFERILEAAEVIVLVGFIVLVFYALFSINP